MLEGKAPLTASQLQIGNNSQPQIIYK